MLKNELANLLSKRRFANLHQLAKYLSRQNGKSIQANLDRWQMYFGIHPKKLGSGPKTIELLERDLATLGYEIKIQKKDHNS